MLIFQANFIFQNKNLKSEENGCPSYFRSILKTMGKMTPEEEAAVMEVTGFWMCTIKNKEWERPVEMEIDGNVMERVKEKLVSLKNEKKIFFIFFCFRKIISYGKIRKTIF